MAGKNLGKWVKGKIFLDRQEDCYIYKRPGSNTWQYYLSITGEGEERRSTKIKGRTDDDEFGKNEALDVAQSRKLEVMARQRQGLKARRVKKMFDFIDDFLKEEKKRIKPFNQKGFITSETFRIKSHHLNLLRKFYKNKSIRLEDLDYPNLYQYPVWRSTPEDKWNPTPPKTNHTISTELTTIKGYFDYLHRLGYIPTPPTFAKIHRESLKENRRDFLNPRQYQQTINTVRSWSNTKGLTDTQTYNRKVAYQSILIMANSLMRIGELRKLRWYDLEPNTNLSEDEQKFAHLIRIRKEISKTGTSRTVQSPTIKNFDTLRELSSIPKLKNSPFPHIPPDRREEYVIGKFNHHDQPFGIGTWERCWKDIKDKCSTRYWNHKNISWYSFRHTGISFAISRGVPLLPLASNAGTGVRYVEDVYYHHLSESKDTWNILSKNRKFYNSIEKHKEQLLVPMEEVLSDDVLDE